MHLKQCAVKINEFQHIYLQVLAFLLHHHHQPKSCNLFSNPSQPLREYHISYTVKNPISYPVKNSISFTMPTIST